MTSRSLASRLCGVVLVVFLSLSTQTRGQCLSTAKEITAGKRVTGTIGTSVQQYFVTNSLAHSVLTLNASSVAGSNFTILLADRFEAHTVFVAADQSIVKPFCAEPMAKYCFTVVGTTLGQKFSMQAYFIKDELPHDRNYHVWIAPGYTKVYTYLVTEAMLGRALQFVITSNSTDLTAMGFVSQSCPRLLAASGGSEGVLALKLTGYGALTLSTASQPVLESGIWHVAVKNTGSEPKHVIIGVELGMPYDQYVAHGLTGFIVLLVFVLVSGCAYDWLGHGLEWPRFSSPTDRRRRTLQESQQAVLIKQRELECAQQKARDVPANADGEASESKLWMWLTHNPSALTLRSIYSNVTRGHGVKQAMYLPRMTLVSGLFFFLPVLIYVYTISKFAANQGDLDVCYFNERCIRPSTWLGYRLFAANNVMSNLGYVILGMACYMLVVVHRKFGHYNCGDPTGKEDQFAEARSHEHTTLALCLSFEGLFSALYHVCPSGFNFAFDSTFMLIMSMVIVENTLITKSDKVICGTNVPVISEIFQLVFKAVESDVVERGACMGANLRCGHTLGAHRCAASVAARCKSQVDGTVAAIACVQRQRLARCLKKETSQVSVRSRGSSVTICDGDHSDS